VARNSDEQPWAVSLGVLAVALRQPDSQQVIFFKHGLDLDCVRALVDFNMMAQYRSHTPEMIAIWRNILTGFTGSKISSWSFEFLNEHGPGLTRSERSSDISDPRATGE